MLLTSAEPHTSALLPASKAPSRANTATSSSTSRRQTIASVAIPTLHPASKTQQGKNKRQRADEMSSDDPLAMERQHKKLKPTAKDLRNRRSMIATRSGIRILVRVRPKQWNEVNLRKSGRTWHCKMNEMMVSLEWRGQDFSCQTFY